MMSVMIKIIGQVKTPADMLKDKLGTPNKSISNLFIPKVSSTENIFTPINSESMALATKNDPKTSNNLLSLVLKVMIY
jgi:hypothetical protein